MAGMANLLRVAACQMAVSGDIETNVARMRAGIEEAAARGAAVVVFPECAVTGYPPLCHKSRFDIDLPAIPAAHDAIRAAAAEAGVWVIAGSILEDRDGLLNTALVIAPDGELCGHYEKLHLIDRDEAFFRAGSRLPVFRFGAGGPRWPSSGGQSPPDINRMEGVTFGVQICYDARFPEPFRLLKMAGVSVIFNLSNACGGDTWKIPVLEGVYRARASENCVYLVAINAAGPLQMTVSHILDVEGLSLAAANQDVEEMIMADLNLDRVGSGHFGNRRGDLFEIVAKVGELDWLAEASQQSNT